jgi:hypothetical protein
VALAGLLFNCPAFFCFADLPEFSACLVFPRARV